MDGPEWRRIPEWGKSAKRGEFTLRPTRDQAGVKARKDPVLRTILPGPSPHRGPVSIIKEGVVKGP